MTFPKPTIDWKINIGNIITLVLIFAAVIAAYYDVENRINKIEIMVINTELQVERLRVNQQDSYYSREVVDMLLQRLDRMEKRIETRLEHIEDNR